MCSNLAIKNIVLNPKHFSLCSFRTPFPLRFLYISLFSACYLVPSRPRGGRPWGDGVFKGAWQLLMLRLGWAPLNATDSRSRSHFPILLPMPKFIGGQQFSFPFAFPCCFAQEELGIFVTFVARSRRKSFPLCGYEVELPDEAEILRSPKLLNSFSQVTCEGVRCSVLICWDAKKNMVQKTLEGKGILRRNSVFNSNTLVTL